MEEAEKHDVAQLVVEKRATVVREYWEYSGEPKLLLADVFCYYVITYPEGTINLHGAR